MPIKHGIFVTESTDGARPLDVVATAVIGLVATGPDADASTFPLNLPVLVTDLDKAIGVAGDGGTLRLALQAIADQVRTPVVVVRVAPGADAAATSVNVIGTTTAGIKTGLQALLAAEAQVQRRPRIIIAPGLDTQAVTAAMVIVAQKLRGMAYASAIGSDVAAAVTYRAQFSARELMLIYPDFVAFDVEAAENATSFGPARAAGLRARIDQEQGWHKTLSNVPVQGVIGLTKDIQWDMSSNATEAATLNDAGITACVHAGGGYRFWGNRTCSEDPLFAFESATRTAQILQDTIAGGLLWAIDKPLRPSLVKDIVETINHMFRQQIAGGYLIGAQAWFDKAKNTEDVLAAGKLLLDYNYTPVPPLEQLAFTQTITTAYFADFASGIGGNVGSLDFSSGDNSGLVR
jgi:phage tail sheath protein FI